MNQAVLEINPEQAIIKKLRQEYMRGSASTAAKDLCNLVYEIAALTGGYRIDDPTAFAKRVTSFVSTEVSGGSEPVASSDGVKDAEVVVEPVKAEPVKAEPVVEPIKAEAVDAETAEDLFNAAK